MSLLAKLKAFGYMAALAMEMNKPHWQNKMIAESNITFWRRWPKVKKPRQHRRILRRLKKSEQNA